MENREIEVKFLLSDLDAFELRLKALGASLVQSRVHEINLRFDTPGQDMTKRQEVLRLRQDQHTVLTFKGPAEVNQTVSVRKEIEFEVSSLEKARDFLEALGYEISFIYEKFRTTYQLGKDLVTLDEMPFGNFSEIEGPKASSLQTTAEELWLDWAERSPMSYTALFNRLKSGLGLNTRDLTFEAFAEIKVTNEDLGLRPADAARG